MRPAHFSFVFLLFAGQVYSQQLTCERTLSFFGPDQQYGTTTGYNGEVIRGVLLQSHLVSFPVGIPERKPSLIAYDEALCDTLWIKTYDSVFYGQVSSPIKSKPFQFAAAGYTVDLSTTGNFEKRWGSCWMEFDQHMNMLNYREYLPTDWSIANVIVRLKDGGYLLSGSRRPYPSVTSAGRVYAMRLDSAGNMLWVKDLHPVATQVLSGLLQLNDGCFLASISEVRPNNQRRPRLVCFNIHGDTLWSRLYNPQGPGIGQTQSIWLWKIVLHSNKGFYAVGTYVNPLANNATQSLFIEFDTLGNEVVRHSQLGSSTEIAFLDSSRFIEMLGYNTTGGISIQINHRDLNYNKLDSFTIASNSTMSWNYFILNDSSDIILTASRDSFPATQDWDLHFARYEQSWGRKYVHNYCGQNLPKAWLSMQLTPDSVFFSDSSASGLRCLPEVYEYRWSIPSLSLSQSGGSSWRLARYQLPYTNFDLHYRIQNYFDCPDSAIIAVDLVNGVLGTPEEVQKSKPRLSLSPNPALEQVAVMIGGIEASIEHLTLYTLSGKQIDLKGRMPRAGILQLQGLPAGVYLLHYLGPEGPQVKKLMVGG